MVSRSKRSIIWIINLFSFIFLFLGFHWLYNNGSNTIHAESDEITETSEITKTNEVTGANEIYVSYSTDSNYIFPTLVSMTSLMEKANSDTFCKFYILHNELSDEDKQKLNSISEKYKNCSVKLVDVKDAFSNSYKRRWSVATYFRLLLPDILNKQNKCLYLDGDTIVRHDLREMFNTNISDSYIAGVHDGYADKEKIENYYYETLGLQDIDSYICGVLLINLEKMRNDNISTTAKYLAQKNGEEKKFRCLDQDILNKICYGHIKLLPFKFGMHTHIFSNNHSETVYRENRNIPQDEFNKMKSDPTIVHFTGGKPWKKIYSNVEKFCREWWDYARKTGYIEEIEKKYPIIQTEEKNTKGL